MLIRGSSSSRLNNQHNWGALCDHLMSTIIFTLTLNKIWLYTSSKNYGERSCGICHLGVIWFVFMFSNFYRWDSHNKNSCCISESTMVHKVDEAYVDSSNFVELSKLMDLSIRSFNMLTIVNREQRFLNLLNLELRKVLISAPQSKILYFPMWCYKGELFYHSKLCNLWATTLAESTWVIFQWKKSLMPILSLKWLHVR